jgi:hypothetical protein
MVVRCFRIGARSHLLSAKLLPLMFGAPRDRQPIDFRVAFTLSALGIAFGVGYWTIDGNIIRDVRFIIDAG